MKKLLIPVFATGLLLALTSLSGTALAVGGSGGPCNIAEDGTCSGGVGGSAGQGSGSGGGTGGHFTCTSDFCFSGTLSGGGGAGGHLSDGTTFGGGNGGKLTCDFDGCVGVGGGGGKP